MSGIVVTDTKGNILYADHKIADKLVKSSTSVDSVLKTVLKCSEKEALDIQQKVLSGKCHRTRLTGITGTNEKNYLVDIKPFFENDLISSLGIIYKEEQNQQAANKDSVNWFLCNMSHELRTPLIGILGSADLLLQSRLCNNQVENVEIVRDCGEKLLDIVNEILNITELELGLVNVDLEICNTFDIFTQVADAIEPIMAKKGLKFRFDLPPKIPVNILTDGSKLTQILLGILNSIVKTTDKEDIIVKADFREESAQQTWLYVKATNSGIPKLWDETNQVLDSPLGQELVTDSGEKPEFGLYVCKKLIALLKGDIWIDSNHNKTDVHFKLPIETVYEQDKQTKSRDNDYGQIPENFSNAFNPPKVLIVEDNPLSQRIVSQMLQTYGFDVSSAANGLECLNILAERDFDVILMDMQMPVMDGYETTRFINNNSNYRNIPVIATTANAMIGDREKCLAAGCVAYMAKPFKVDELVRVIKKHLLEKPCSSQKKDPQSTFCLTELIPEFIELLSDMIGDLDIAAEEKNFKMIKDISHDIKGTAGMYGFAKISNLATLIEQAAKVRNKENINNLIRQLHNLFEQTSAQVS